MKIRAVPLFSLIAHNRSMIWACIVTSSAVVGSSAMMSFGSQMSAIAIITRCAHPAGKLVRIFVIASFWQRDAHIRECGERALSRFGSLRRKVRAPAFAYLIADCEDRVQRTHRLLKNHGDVAATDASHLTPRKREKILPSKIISPVTSAAPGSNRMSARPVIDLPHPLSPTTPILSPGASENVMSRVTARAERPVLNAIPKPLTLRRVDAFVEADRLSTGRALCSHA